MQLLIYRIPSADHCLGKEFRIDPGENQRGILPHEFFVVLHEWQASCDLLYGKFVTVTKYGVGDMKTPSRLVTPHVLERIVYDGKTSITYF